MQRAANTFIEGMDREGEHLDFSDSSVNRLDGLIDEFWPRGPSEDTLNYTAPMIGAFLGEVIVRNIGGRWVDDREFNQPAVEYGEERILPISKVLKRLTEGPEHSLGIFYAEIRETWKHGDVDRRSRWRRLR